MLQVHDIREARGYQEAKDEGIEFERRRIIAAMAAMKMTAEEIARILDLNPKAMTDTQEASQ